MYLFVSRFIIRYVGTLCICVAAARTTKALRKHFLQKLPGLEITDFDVKGGGAVAGQVTTNGNRIPIGIAENFYTCVAGISMFFCVFVVALAVRWKLALITMSNVPGMILFYGACAGAIIPIENDLERLYSQAGTIAQYALGSIGTILAFGAQGKVLGMYDGYLQSAYKIGQMKAVISGVMFSIQTFFTLAANYFAFWQGSRLYQSGEIADVGEFISHFQCHSRRHSIGLLPSPAESHHQ